MLVTSQVVSFPLVSSERHKFHQFPTLGHFVSQYLKDPGAWHGWKKSCLTKFWANNNNLYQILYGTKFRQYLIWNPDASHVQGWRHFPLKFCPFGQFSTPQHSLTVKGKDKQLMIVWREKMQLNSLINFDALLAGCWEFWSPIY